MVLSRLRPSPVLRGIMNLVLMMMMLAVEMNVINAANFRSAPNWNELRKGADLVLLLVINCHCSTQWWWSRHRRWSGEGLQERVKHLRQQPLERGRLLLTFIKLKMKMAMLTIVSGDEWPHSGNCEESLCSWLLQVGWLVSWWLVGWLLVGWSVGYYRLEIF